LGLKHRWVGRPFSFQGASHDWFSHERGTPSSNDFEVPPDANDNWKGGSTMRIPRTPPDRPRSPEGSKLPPTYRDRESHWWDASQIYGNTEEDTDKLKDPLHPSRLKNVARTVALVAAERQIEQDSQVKDPLHPGRSASDEKAHPFEMRDEQNNLLKDAQGNQVYLDLAAVDIMRDRERGVPRYNEFRRLLHKPPVKTFEEITSNRIWAQELKEVYGGDVNRVDLMVGMFAEDLPEGFGFSDTAFRVFILMASGGSLLYR
jgi:hypothetical protein